MDSAVAIIGLPELIGILIILGLIVGANQIAEMLAGKRHRNHQFKRVTREVLRDSADGEGESFRLHEFIFWLIAAIVVATYAVALLELL